VDGVEVVLTALKKLVRAEEMTTALTPVLDQA